MPQDPFSKYRVSAPAPTAPAADPFASFRIQTQAPRIDPVPARAEDFMPEQPGSFSLGDTLSGLWSSINPLPAIQAFAKSSEAEWSKATAAASRGDYYGALLHTINAHPVTQAGHVAVGIGKQQWDQAVQARKAFKQGRYSEGVGHAGAALLPVLGPAAAQTGETIAKGELDRGLGEAVGLAGGVLAPGMIKRSRGVEVKGPLRNPNPVEADAVAFGQQAGIPIDAATATGNTFVRGAQAISEHSMPGSVIGGAARAAQQKGLATIGEQLAAKAHPTAVTPEMAGQGIRDAVLEQVRTHAGKADEAYSTIRKIEADPKHRRIIEEPGPDLGDPNAWGTTRIGGRFAKSGASVEELFQGALGDARATGYQGTADNLRALFMDRLASAKRLGQEMAESVDEVGPKALLADIRRLGGLRPFDKDWVPGSKSRKLRGDFESIVEGFSSQSGWGQRGGASPFRNNGLALDDLVDQLRADPKWQPLIGDTNDLLTALDDIARQGPASVGVSTDLENLLRATGVEKGSDWWKPASKSVEINLPVDLRGVKQALQPIYDELMARYPIAQQEASRGLKAIENIVKGPDYAPLSTTDANLGAIKSIARSDLPELRSVSQGTAAQAVKALDEAVQRAASEADPEAWAALMAGRKATVEKYAAGDVLETLNRRGEPVRDFKALTAGQDAAIEQLRDIAKQAPAELPKLGRAFLDDLIGQATVEGGFKHGAALARKWESLGPETKRLLYKDPQHVKDLDRFFLLAKKTAESPNPSGSALVGSVGGGIAHVFLHPASGIPLQLAQGAIAKLLHSPRGVRLLTQGFRIPAGNKAAATAWAGELAAFAHKQGIELAPVMASESREPNTGSSARR